MNRMTENFVFLRSLRDHSSQLKAMVGEEWSAVQQEIWEYLLKMLDAEDDDFLSLWLDQLSRTLERSQAGPLVRQLRRQARQAQQPGSPLEQAVQQEVAKGGPQPQAGTIRVSVPITDPVTGRSRDMEITLVMPSTGATPTISRTEVITAGRELADELVPPKAAMEPDITFRDVEPVRSDREAGETAGATTRPVKSYPNLQGADHAYLAQSYALTVKLSDQPQQDLGDHISAPEMEIEAEAGEVIKKIQVRLEAPDFQLEPEDPAEIDQGWQRTLNFYVEAGASGPVVFKLRPQNRYQARYFAPCKLTFLIEGQPVGEAFRWVEVLQDETAAPTPPADFPAAPTFPLDEKGTIRTPATLPRHRRPMTYSPPPDPDQQVHLTVTIEKLRDIDPEFRWSFASPYLAGEVLPTGTSPDLGRSAFVGDYLAPFGMIDPGFGRTPHMDRQGRLKQDSVATLLGVLQQLRHHAPAQFWDTYQRALAAHQAQGRSPETFTILLHTSDCHIPWELMPVTDAVEAEQMPPLLGSAHRVGRWLVGLDTLSPARTLNLHGFALVAPVYSEQPLPQAQLERRHLEARYQPHPVIETPQPFRQLVKVGAPTGGTGILHFAGHGDCCKDAIRRLWLILSDDEEEALYDVSMAGNDLGNKLGKLVSAQGRDVLAFFNACNVGRSVAGPLGSNGDWGRALLSQQYKGYIGPLWSVFDEHARDASQTFYSLALERPQLPLGEVMRRIRLKFQADNRLFTYLAYLYLGHPLAVINYSPVTQN